MDDFIVNSVPRQRLLLAVVAVGAFMANLDTCIVNVSLPTIAHEYDVSPSAVSLVVLAYLLCEVSFLLLFGKLGEIWGMSRIFLLGVAVFTVGSLLCGLSPSFVHLIGWRALQGVGGSMIFAVMLVFPGLYLPAGKRAAAMGVITTAAALGVAAGLADRYGGRSVCSAGLLLSALAFALFCLLDDLTAIWFIVLALSLFGLSQGLNKAPNINLAMEDVPALRKPLAGSVISVARSLGLAAGVVAFETVFSEAIPHRVSIENVSVQAAHIDPGLLQHGFTVAFLLGVALSLLALYLMLRLRAPRATETVEHLGGAVHSPSR
jgi:MFS family permease